MTAEPNPDAAHNDSPFLITRVFHAPRALVWRAWTEADRLAAWWGPKGFVMGTVKLDLRPGGSLHYSMRSPQGYEMWGKFIYREITPPERMIFTNSFSDEAGGLTRHPMSPTWPLEVLNTLTLTEAGGKTTLTLHGGPIDATETERLTFAQAQQALQHGFAGTFDQLEEYLVKNPT